MTVHTIRPIFRHPEDKSHMWGEIRDYLPKNYSWTIFPTSGNLWIQSQICKDKANIDRTLGKFSFCDYSPYMQAVYRGLTTRFDETHKALEDFMLSGIANNKCKISIDGVEKAVTDVSPLYAAWFLSMAFKSSNGLIVFDSRHPTKLIETPQKKILKISDISAFLEDVKNMATLMRKCILIDQGEYTGLVSSNSTVIYDLTNTPRTNYHSRLHWYYPNSRSKVFGDMCSVIKSGARFILIEYDDCFSRTFELMNVFGRSKFIVDRISAEVTVDISNKKQIVQQRNMIILTRKGS